jgi:nicotinamidase-related amidase
LVEISANTVLLGMQRKTKFKVNENDALIIVDVQVDFCPGGRLPVPRGDGIIPVLNRYIDLFERVRARVFATRDWHPPNHISFEERGGPWPAHCVQGSDGARFHPDLRLPEDVIVISKATDQERESYSGFDGTELDADLRKNGVRRVFVGGLATDYCVKNTVLDGLRRGFDVVLLIDATKGIDRVSGDSKRAIREMTSKGARTAAFSDLSAV